MCTYKSEFFIRRAPSFFFGGEAGFKIEVKDAQSLASQDYIG